MTTNVGLWIDHRAAAIVFLAGKGVTITHLDSHAGKHVRYKGAPHEKAEDQRDRKFDGRLNRYYDTVTEVIRHADSILILGPGEAKGELAKRLQQQGLGNRVAPAEAADKMTDAQIVARVKAHFSEN